jgi:hypothetical protein
MQHRVEALCPGVVDVLVRRYEIEVPAEDDISLTLDERPGVGVEAPEPPKL